MPYHPRSNWALHLEQREPQPNPQPLPAPVDGLDFLAPRQEPNRVIARAASTDEANPLAPKNTCGPNDNTGVCQKPTDAGSSITLPVVLGSVIPLTIAIIILLVLHRRHVKKLKLEDKNDRHKSLDFGMDEVERAGGGRNKRSKKGTPPEMNITDTEKTLRRGRGMSLDMGNPYLLPPGLQNSRESLHSLSRTIHGEDDRYGKATNYIPNDETRSYSPSMRRALDDNSSTLTGSSRNRDDMSKNLLQNAQRMSRTIPPTFEISSPSGQNIQEPAHAYIIPQKDLPQRPNRSLDPSPSPSQRSRDGTNDALRNSNMYLSKFIHSRDPSADLLTQTKRPPKSEPTQPEPEPEKPLTFPARSSPSPPQNALPQNPRPHHLQSTEAPTLPSLLLPDIEKDKSAFQEHEFTNQRDEHPINDREPSRERHEFQPNDRDVSKERSELGYNDREPWMGRNEFKHNDREFSRERDSFSHNEHDFSGQRDQYSHNANEFSGHEVDYAHNEHAPVPPPHDNLYPSANSRVRSPERRVSGRFSLDAQDPSGYYEQSEYGYDDQEFQGNPNRRTMGFVPLPPEDPNDTPEERATRIKSFYKEYFDSSKPGPRYNQQYNGHGQQYHDQQMPPRPYNGYYEDYETYDQEYQYDGAAYDEANGQFVTGQNHFYEEPITRRAMTPPPRGPPRFRGPPGHMSSGSGEYMPGPRAYSSASNQYPGGTNRRGPPKKMLPPPKALQTLPTPHLLKDDTFVPIDFAPPSSIRDRVAGRPDSPLGIKKPYSPMLPSHVPIASSFDELSMMPSPHALRKSGTFTALDFAPPARFKNSDSGSDAGSMRSGRSGMSASQLQNIRAGAYRLSRIPKEVSGTKNELADSLRPKWDMSR